MKTVSYYSFIYGMLPMYEYKVWEKVMGHRAEVIFEGAAFRRKTAERKAKEIIAHMEGKS